MIFWWVQTINIVVSAGICADKLGLGASQLEKLAVRAMEKIYGKTDGSELQILR